MSKKVINQNTNYDLELINSIGSDFIFDEKPINRLKKIPTFLKKTMSTKKKKFPSCTMRLIQLKIVV